MGSKRNADRWQVIDMETGEALQRHRRFLRARSGAEAERRAGRRVSIQPIEEDR